MVHQVQTAVRPYKVGRQVIRYNIPISSPTGSCTPRNQVIKPKTTSAQVYTIKTSLKKKGQQTMLQEQRNFTTSQ